MRRVDQGDIVLDGALAAQLPDFSIDSRFADAQPITVRALLAHHCGLPSDRLNGMWTQSPVDLATLQDQLHAEGVAPPPQGQYKYSNLDYDLLGRLIEVRARESFVTAMQQDLLEPLGMTQSTFGLASQAASRMAKGYRDGNATPAVELRDRPAGSLITSVNDLARFIRFVLADGRTETGKPLLTASTLRAMFAPQFAGLPLDFGNEIGLGWMIAGVHVPGLGHIAWHNGEYPGYYGSLMIARERKLGVVILANGQAAKGFVIQVGSKALQLALAARLGVAVPAAEDHKSEPQRIAMSDAQLAQYAGEYVVFGQLSSIASPAGSLPCRRWAGISTWCRWDLPRSCPGWRSPGCSMSPCPGCRYTSLPWAIGVSPCSTVFRSRFPLKRYRVTRYRRHG